MSYSKEYEIFPVGYIKKNEKDISIVINVDYKTALKQLEYFSHVNVIWWFSSTDDKECREVLENQPPYKNSPTTGVFASRSPVRPNPLALTTVKILHIDHENGIIKIENIDAFDNTPVIDIKAYMPICDRIKEVEVPEWISHWDEWMEETVVSNKS